MNILPQKDSFSVGPTIEPTSSPIQKCKNLHSTIVKDFKKNEKSVFELDERLNKRHKEGKCTRNNKQAQTCVESKHTNFWKTSLNWEPTNMSPPPESTGIRFW